MSRPSLSIATGSALFLAFEPIEQVPFPILSHVTRFGRARSAAKGIIHIPHARPNLERDDEGEKEGKDCEDRVGGS